MDRPMNAKCSCSSGVTTIRTNSFSSLLHSSVNSLATPISLDALNTQSSIPTNSLVGRHHPYAHHLPLVSRGAHRTHHSYGCKMGNQHGKVVFNGETYDTHKLHQTFMQMKGEVDFYKVSANF